MCLFIQYIVCISSIAFLIHITFLYPGKRGAERMINSQSTITLRPPYSDGTAQPTQRLPWYSEGIILIPAVFNKMLQLQKVITLINKSLKNNKCAEVEYIIYRKKKLIKQKLTNTKLENIQRTQPYPNHPYL